MCIVPPQVTDTGLCLGVSLSLSPSLSFSLPVSLKRALLKIRNKTETFLIYSNNRTRADGATLACLWLTLVGVNVVCTCVMQPGVRLLFFYAFLQLKCVTKSRLRVMLPLHGLAGCGMISVLRGQESLAWSKDKEGSRDWGGGRLRLLSASGGDVKLILINVENREDALGPLPPASLELMMSGSAGNSAFFHSGISFSNHLCCSGLHEACAFPSMHCF